MTTRGTKYWKSGTIPLIGPDILGDIIAEVADIAVVIDEQGKVLSVLSNAKYDGGPVLQGREGEDFAASLSTESVSKFESRLEAYKSGEVVRAVELNHREGAERWEFPIRYSFHHIGPDGTVLLLGTDLRPVAEMQQQLVKAQLALERDLEVQREYDSRFRVLMMSTTEPHIFVSANSGQITEANPAAAQLLDMGEDQLNGSRLAECFDTGGAFELVDSLVARALEGRPQTGAQTRSSEIDVVIFPTLFRVSGERVLLCRIVTNPAEIGYKDDLGGHLRTLHDLGPEGIVFIRADGKVLSTNDGFLDLIGLAHGIDVRERDITDFLLRGSVDLKVMTENAERFGKMRFYSTKIASDYGSPRSVEVSITSIEAGAEKVFALVIRDANRTDVSRTSPAVPSEDVQSVVELVGSATLKEIVAETTNVIERMCIETAIELTMNNRVAAAEMLGLSRQSLYVKLRKLNLLSREEKD